MSNYAVLGQPFQIAGVTIKNRYAYSPVTTATMWDESGHITPKFIRYFEDRAKGDFGLIVTGAITTDTQVDPYQATGPSPLTNPEAFVTTSKDLLDRVHAHGGKLFCQLSLGLGRNYPGLPSPSENIVFHTTDTLSPVLTTEQIQQKIAQYIQAAKLAYEAGWDGIEVHAMHWGYLLDQFCMTCFNRRTDQYGGSWENNLRAAREIVEGVKAVTAKDYPVGMRFSLETFVKGANEGLLTPEGEKGRTLEESLLCARLLEQYGYDYLSVDTGVYDSFYYACPPMYMPQSFMFDMAAKCKAEVHIPVICGGRMNDASACADAIEAGKFDAITLGRPGIADPDYPKKAIAGQIDAIRPCLGCNYGCFKKVCMEAAPMTCAVNPIAAHEIDLDLKPGEGEKQVVVVGGGVGGMECARTAARRGYQVTLFEKSDRLGGHLIEAGAHSFKTEIAQLHAWYQRELAGFDNVKIVLNHEATTDELLACEADAIVLATGAVTAMPPIPGLEKAVRAVDAINHPEQLGQKIVIAGGGLVGCEIAYDEKLRGKDVTVVELLDDIMIAGVPTPWPNAMMIQALFEQKGICALTSTKVVEVTDTGVVTEDKAGTRQTIEADTVVNALGFKALNNLESALQSKAIKVCVIGDARQPANVLQAVADGYAVANSL